MTIDYYSLIIDDCPLYIDHYRIAHCKIDYYPLIIDYCCMSWELQKLHGSEIPELLREADPKLSELSLVGTLPEGAHLLTVVGSRSYTPYGRRACESLLAGLAGYPIAIVSGLALGIDTIAHQTALAHGLHTIAIPGSGLQTEVLYPASNRGLAHKILQSGGALLSPFAPDTKAARYTFPIRNAVMAGMTQATLVIEAGEKSGTLITARLATEFNRDVLVVPGSIFSDSSKGSNALIRQGAHPVTNSADILDILGIQSDTQESLFAQVSLTEVEAAIMRTLDTPKRRDEILRLLSLDPTSAAIAFSGLEIKGCINESGGKFYKN
ncbi:MAG: DNA processing protein [Planctomycetota bacterium]|jgi:DNA processing protein